MARSYITDEQKKLIWKMTNQGSKQKDIIEETGLKGHQVAHQMQNARKAARKEVKKIIRKPSAERPQAGHKPMIALVGNPDEVTKSLRELFS